MKCETCVYYVNDKNNENFCAYYCLYITEIYKLQICKFLEYKEEDDNNQN